LILLQYKNAVRLYLTDDFLEYIRQDLWEKWIHDYYKLDEELKSSIDPFYVFESIAKSLTNNELKELFMSGLIIKFVISPDGKYHVIFNDEKMWNSIESRSDQKEILEGSLKVLLRG